MNPGHIAPLSQILLSPLVFFFCFVFLALLSFLYLGDRNTRLDSTESLVSYR